MTEELLKQLPGKTIEGVALRERDDDLLGEYQVLRVDFTDKSAIEISSKDYEGYRSWLVFEG